MLILKVIIWFLLLILHKMSYHIFANQFWNQLQYKSSNSSETYVNFEGNFLFLRLILHKMSYHIFANQFWNLIRNQIWNQVLNQLQYKSFYCSDT